MVAWKRLLSPLCTIVGGGGGGGGGGEGEKRGGGGGGGGWTQGEKLDGKVSFKQSFSRTRSLIPQSKDWIGHPYDQSTDARVYDVV